MKSKRLFWLLAALVFGSLITTGILFSDTHPALFWTMEGIAALSLILFVSLYRRLIKPYHILLNGMELLNEQDFSNRLRLVGNDEANRLIEIFNRMMTELKNERLQVRETNRFLDLLNTDGFAPWFSIVTPLTEIGLLPIGSRPAKRGLGAKSLDDLRTIPWIFSWAQARINLAAWYGLGTACEKFGDLETMRKAYEEWPLFSTFIDNIEMSIAKTDERIARMYLALGDREDLNKKVLEEMELTRKWVLAIVGDKWPLQHRHVLGQAIRIRSPYVDALSVTQVLALKSLRKKVDKEELSQSQQAGFIYLILCTVSGVAAGLQNTG